MFKRIVNHCLFLFLIFPILSQETENTKNNRVHKETERLTKLQAKYYKIGAYEIFKKYTDTILKHAQQNNLKNIEIDAVNRLGVYHKKLGEYDKAMEYYFEALTLSKTLHKDYKKRTSILINLGNVYNSIGNYHKANATYKEAEEYIDTYGGPDEYKMSIYVGMSDAFKVDKKFKTSLEYLEKAKKIGEKLHRDDIIINALNGIAENYLELKEYDTSLLNSQKATSLYTTGQSIQQRALSFYLTGASLVGLKKYDEATLPLQMAQGTAFTNDFLKIQMNTHKSLAKVFEKQGDLKKAIAQQKGYVAAKERFLLNLSKAKRLEISKELTETEDLLKKENIFKWSSILISLMVIFILITILLIYIRKKKVAELNTSQLKENQALLKDENEALKTKILKLVQQRSTISLSKNKEKNTLKKSSLSQEKQEEYVNHILNYMENEKPYLNHEIKQSNLAKELNMSVHLFSEVLNICFQKNFNNFMNLYRVNRAKQLIKNPKFFNYKILAIGYESGFPSKSSFNRAFKQMVQQTPSEYRQEQLQLLENAN